METMLGESRGSLFLDTNVLLIATAPGRKAHQKALALVSRGDRLFLSSQIVREYLVVATRPTDQNGLGLSLEAALDNVSEFLKRTTRLEEGGETWLTWLQLIERVPCSGKQLHDAYVAATAIAHKIPILVTENVQHFRRFEPELRVIDLAEAV